jgi:hypothetical protein
MVPTAVVGITAVDVHSVNVVSTGPCVHSVDVP